MLSAIVVTKKNRTLSESALRKFTADAKGSAISFPIRAASCGPTISRPSLNASCFPPAQPPGVT